MIQNKSKTQGIEIGQAQIEWLEGTVPCSARFDDPYYSRQDGLAETRHVFLAGNRLAERFADAGRFTVAELGFGTGLNFLATAMLWNETASPGATFDFFSFEQFPMAATDMAAALAVWPELAALAKPLCDAWDNRGDGMEAFQLTMASTRLTVFLGDANIRLPQASLWPMPGFSTASHRPGTQNCGTRPCCARCSATPCPVAHSLPIRLPAGFAAIWKRPGSGPPASPAMRVSGR